jgi:hypothetical protein
MAITRITDTDDDGSGTTGTIHNNAWLQTVFDAIELNWAWDTYTPSWTASSVNPAIGNGTISGRYFAIGKLVIAEIILTPGSTTTFGTGDYRLTVPTAAAAGAPIIGVADAADAGTANHIGVTRQITTTTFAVLVTASASIWGTTVPMTWANGDSARFLVAYRAA